MTYQNTSDAPSTATRTLSLQASDGTDLSTPVTRTVAVTAVNDAPVLANIEGASLAYTEGDAPKAITATLTIADPDSTTLADAAIAITGNFTAGQDVRLCERATDHRKLERHDGRVSLSGTATLAQYQAALRTVTYQNTSDNPSLATRNDRVPGRRRRGRQRAQQYGDPGHRADRRRRRAGRTTTPVARRPTPRTRPPPRSTPASP